MTLTSNSFKLPINTLEEGQQFLTWLEWGGHEELAEEIYLKQLKHDLDLCKDKAYFVADLQRQVNNIAQYVSKGNSLQHIKLRAYSKFLRKNALGIN